MPIKSAVALSLLLTVYTGAVHSQMATINSPANQEPCTVGSSCQDMGGDVFAEEERLNQGLKADSDKRMETDAEKIRNQSQKDMEKTIEKLERQQ